MLPNVRLRLFTHFFIRHYTVIPAKHLCVSSATCKAGPGAMPMWILDICIWSFLILQFVDRCYFRNSTFDLSKWHLYIKILMFLKLSCQGLNLRPKSISQDILDLKLFPARLEPPTFRLASRSLHQSLCIFYTKELILIILEKIVKINSLKILINMCSIKIST